MSRVAQGKRNVDDEKKGKLLLQDVGTLNKNMYLDRNSSKGASVSVSSKKAPLVESNVKSKRGDDGSQNKDKKSSFWNWKPLKALSHVRNRRFNCCFTLQVHKIEGLPPDFNGLSLCVHWKRRDGEVMTSPVKVVKGVVEFEEGLTHTCSVYGSRSGPHHSAKYEAKHFLLYVAVYGDMELDLGKHRVDLTRLLPLTLEELVDEKSSGKWNTTYQLSGRAKGAVMSVSFGYLVLGDSPAPAPNNKRVLELLSSRQSNLSSTRTGAKSAHGDEKGTVRHTGSLPSQSQRSFVTSRSTKDIKVLHEVLPVTKLELSDSLKALDEKFDQKLETGVDMSALGVPSPTDDSFDHHDDWNPSPSPLSIPHEECLQNEAEDRPSSISMTVPESSPNGLVDDPGEVVQGSSSLESTSGRDVVDDDVELKENRGLAENRESIEVDDHLLMHDSVHDAKDICAKAILLEELDSAFNDVAHQENAAPDSAFDDVLHIENATPDTPKVKGGEDNLEAESSWMDIPGGLEDLAEVVETEFLDMLGLKDSPTALSSEAEPESPRERLLRDFEKENSACCLFDFDTDDHEEEEYHYNAPRVPEWLGDDTEMPSASWEDDNPLLFDRQGTTFRPRARALEDMETGALMQEWGLDDKAFQNTPMDTGAGFGSPIDLPPDEPAGLPPLGEGLGPYVQTKNGGFVRSMNPSLFSNAKSGGSLVMQVSSPVVVPAEMGPGVTEILEHLSSIGLEKLSVQAHKLMPLEDITGKTMEQIAWEASPKLEGSQRQDSSQLELDPALHSLSDHKRGKGKSSRRQSKKRNLSIPKDDMNSEYVSLEDLAPLAMDKIESLSVEGLRIQSGVSEEPPSNRSTQTIREFPVFQAGTIGMEGAVGLQLLDLKDNKDEVEGLMDLSITLDEWMRLDAGEVDEDQMSERTSRILAAHHATSTDLSFVGKKGKKHTKGKGSGKRCGLLGNNFTVALMVQLRDPLRNYEPVGMPMFALIQVERVFLPQKPRIHSTVTQIQTIDEDDEELETVVKVETKEDKKEEKILEEVVPQYKIADVHLAGLKTEPGKKKLWGGKVQQQSGSRWLLANGMGKSNKHPLLKARVVTKSSFPAASKPEAGNSFWSISGRSFSR